MSQEPSDQPGFEILPPAADDAELTLEELDEDVELSDEEERVFDLILRIQEKRTLPEYIWPVLENPSQGLLDTFVAGIGVEAITREWLGPATEVALAVLVNSRYHKGLKALLELVSIEDEMYEDLLDSWLLERLDTAFANFTERNPEDLVEIASLRDLPGDTLSCAMHGLLILWARGAVPHARIISLFHQWLAEALETKNEILGDAILRALVEYPLPPLLPQIRQVIESELGGEYMDYDRDFADASLTDGTEEAAREHLLEHAERWTELRPWVESIHQLYRPKEPKKTGSNYGRNDWVRLELDGATQDVKFKKAQALIDAGWVLKGRTPGK